MGEAGAREEREGEEEASSSTVESAADGTVDGARECRGVRCGVR